jgi:hypothetical protein
MTLTGENRGIRRKIGHSDTLSVTDFTEASLELEQASARDRRGSAPVAARHLLSEI